MLFDNLSEDFKIFQDNLVLEETRKIKKQDISLAEASSTREKFGSSYSNLVAFVVEQMFHIYCLWMIKTLYYLI